MSSAPPTQWHYQHMLPRETKVQTPNAGLNGPTCVQSTVEMPNARSNDSSLCQTHQCKLEWRNGTRKIQHRYRQPNGNVYCQMREPGQAPVPLSPTAADLYYYQLSQPRSTARRCHLTFAMLLRGFLVGLSVAPMHGLVYPRVL